MSAVPVEQRAPMTAEELLTMPDDGMRHELVRGELTTMAPAGWEHGVVSARVVELLSSFVRAKGLGVVLTTDTGFTIEREPDTVRAPDAAFVRADRVPAPEDRRGFAELAPDLVVEVVSPNDRWTEVTDKALMWLDAGVRLVWVVDPAKRLVVVHRERGDDRLRGDAVLDGEDVLPGFRLPLADLFA